jgi:WD40 repeat protein
LLATVLAAATLTGPATCGDTPSERGGEPAPLPGLLASPRSLPGIGRWQMAHRIPRGRIYAVAFSPDGKRIAYSESFYLRLCDAQTFQTQRFLAGHRHRVSSIDWNRATGRIASGSLDRTVRIWSGEGVPEKTLEGPQAAVHSVAWTRDGARLAAAVDDGTIWIWKSDGTHEHTINASAAAVNSVAWHPDGTRLVAGDDNHQVKLWSVDGRPGPLCEGHLGRVTAVAYSPDGKRFASTTWGYKSEDTAQYVVDVRIWKEDGSQAGLANGELPNYGMAWSPDGTALAVVNERGQLRILGPDGKQRSLRPVPNLGDGMDEPSLAWKPDGSEIVIGATSMVTVVPVDASMQVRASDQSLVARSNLPTGVSTVSSDGNVAVMRVLRPTPRATWWNLAKGSSRLLPAEVAAVLTPAVSPQGDRLVYSNERQQLFVWDAASTEPRKIAESGLPIQQRAWNPKEDLIAFSDTETTVRVLRPDGTKVAEWNVKTAAPNGPLAGAANLRNLEWSADGKTLIAAADAGMQVFQPDGKPLAGCPASGLIRAWVSTDQQHFGAAISDNRKAALRSFGPGGAEAKLFSGLPDDVESYTFSPDGKHLLFGRDNGEWELRSIDEPAAAETGALGHVNGTIMAVEFSPDGTRFATGGWDGIVNVWKLDGSLDRSLVGQTHPIYRLWWTGDGKRLSASSRIAGLAQWTVDNERLEWLMVPGEENTSVALYADGRVATPEPDLPGKMLLVFVEQPGGGTQLVDAAKFLKEHGLVVR